MRTPKILRNWNWGAQAHHVFVLILTLFQLISWSSSFPAIGLGGTSGPLYGPTDFVYILNASTIQQTVFASDRAWLVEFYSSWCGHCISFAPKWKQLADDLKEWRSLVAIAGIDCADEANVPSCREFEIMGYPALKLFPNNAKAKITDLEGKEVLNIGDVFTRSFEVEILKKSLMDALLPVFPKTLGANNSIGSMLSIPDEFWKDAEFSQGPPFLLIIYESNNSYVGLEVAFRLSRYPNSVRVLRFHQKTPLYDYLNLDGWPAAGYISKDKSSGSLSLAGHESVSDLLTTSVIGLAQINKIQEIPEVEIGWATVEIVKDDAENLPSKSEDKVSMEDLMHTVRNLLRNEVGLFQKLDGTKLGALKNFVNILVQYFPADRREVKIFLSKLSDWIRPRAKIENVKYLEKLNELELELNPWDIDMHTWYDCRATVPGRRGYTCGLWRLFHTLTVIGLEKHENSPILSAIHGYVKEFFGCKECAKHFGDMVDRDDALKLRSIHEQTIWLWKAHNEVSLRLKGTPSEDPAFLKGYYPTLEHCTQCYTRPEAFDEAKVEEYLLKVYARPERYLDKQNSKSGQNVINTNSASHLRSMGWIGGYFSFTDVGIFVLLYLSIVLLLVFAYIHFKVARRRRYDPIFCLHRLWSRIMKKYVGFF